MGGANLWERKTVWFLAAATPTITSPLSESTTLGAWREGKREGRREGGKEGGREKGKKGERENEGRGREEGGGREGERGREREKLICSTHSWCGYVGHNRDTEHSLRHWSHSHAPVCLLCRVHMSEQLRTGPVTRNGISPEPPAPG